MTEFKPYIIWGIDYKVEYNSIDDLEFLIDKFTEEALQKEPFSVQIVANTRTALLITIGRKESHMEFYDENQRPLIVGCIGPWEEDSLISYMHGGELSEIEKRYCVNMDDAREAMRFYVLTGMRPENIKWGE